MTDLTPQPTPPHVLEWLRRTAAQHVEGQPDDIERLRARIKPQPGERVARPGNRCFWCGKNRRAMSDWEQDHHSKGWQRLCKPCATRRLANPFNALLPMRKVAQP